ncbi:elongin C [Thecaphora frezii]
MASTETAKDPEWVTLISEDDFRFVVEYKCAIASGTIKTMLSMGEGGTCRSLLRLNLTPPRCMEVYRERLADSSGFLRVRSGSMGRWNEVGGFAEAESHTAHLQIRGEVLEKIVEYLHWKTKYSAAENDLEVPDFQNRIPPEIALELLMAADFLDV